MHIQWRGYLWLLHDGGDILENGVKFKSKQFGSKFMPKAGTRKGTHGDEGEVKYTDGSLIIKAVAGFLSTRLKRAMGNRYSFLPRDIAASVPTYNVKLPVFLTEIAWLLRQLQPLGVQVDNSRGVRRFYVSKGSKIWDLAINGSEEELVNTIAKYWYSG